MYLSKHSIKPIQGNNYPILNVMQSVTRNRDRIPLLNALTTIRLFASFLLRHCKVKVYQCEAPLVKNRNGTVTGRRQYRNKTKDQLNFWWIVNIIILIKDKLFKFIKIDVNKTIPMEKYVLFFYFL